MNGHDPYHSVVTALSGIVVLLLVGCFLTIPVSAHPPSAMVLSYDELSKDLQVTITHPVPDPQNHYINKVIVTINGNVAHDSRYTSQPGTDTFTYTYPVETVTGDEIRVTASCSLAGSLARTLYNTGPVATAPAPSPAGQPTQKAAAGFVPLLGASAALLIRKK